MLIAQVEQFITQLSANETYSHNTILAYQNDLMQFCDFFGEDKNWVDIEMPALESYINQLRDQGYASSTVARKVASVKTFLTYLQEEGKISTNIAKQVGTPKVERSTQPLLSAEQVGRLLAVTGNPRSPKLMRNRLLLNLLYETNLRISELVQLTIHEIEGNSLAGILLNEDLNKYLQDYLEWGRPGLLSDTYPDETALFLNHRGSALTRQGLWLIIKECAQKANLQVTVTPRMLRQSFSFHKKQGSAS